MIPTMTFLNNVNSERMSEEAHGDFNVCLTTETAMLCELGFDSLCANTFESGCTDGNAYDLAELAEAIMQSVEPNELNSYLGPANPQNPYFGQDNNLALMNNLPVRSNRKDSQRQLNTRQIELSQSVGVGLSQNATKSSSKISIMHELEELYRPRYKSDYFGQNGVKRKPRYVADRFGNHCITLKILHGVRGIIRIDWLTIPTETGDRYSMPYNFQINNESMDVPDCNPMFITIATDSVGVMKVYAVLIKSKQDALKSLQPLTPFRPYQDVFGIDSKKYTEQIARLSPKKLIKKYQLDKSQLAFTFCALSSDGTSCIPQWDTTVFSTVLTEVQPDISKRKSIACPNCTHIFQLPMGDGDDDDDVVQAPIVTRRKPNRYCTKRLMQTAKWHW